MNRSCVNIFAGLLGGMVLAGPVARGDDAAPTTVPTAAQLPGMKLESKFDMNRIVGEIIAKRENDPIGALAQDMGIATGWLADLKTNDPVQPHQQQIIVRLDELIAMLEKDKKAKAGGGANPTSPLPDSVLAGGPGGRGAMRDPNASSRNWGQLPPKQREQILQSQNEGFPAGFEAILSSYYKRLAQENAGEPAASPESPPQAPVP